MCRYILLSAFLYMFGICAAQNDDNSLSFKITEYLTVLASDSLKGRGNYTINGYKAASYIASEFSKDSLQKFPGFNSHLIPFKPGGRLKEKWKNENGVYDPEKVLYNVVGMIEGKTHPAEVIIFSSHYDHMGVIKRKKGDSIYNGANDNASGTSALMAIAKYFSQKKNNARTLIFCAFGGEELGLLGSYVFSGHLKASSIVAVINIEMIGRYPSGNKNHFFITGSEYSGLSKIIQKNLEGSPVKIVEEPHASLGLFQRSDNLPFAMKGVPAHTIMSSSDTDECYHQTCDEMSRIDFQHLENIIRAIIVSTQTIVDGKETPSRIIKKIEKLY